MSTLKVYTDQKEKQLANPPRKEYLIQRGKCAAIYRDL